MRLVKVSYSALSTYFSCPYKYYLSYLRNIRPEKKAKALCVGGAIHSVLAEFYRKKQNNQILQLLEAQDIFKKGLEKEPILLHKNDSIEKIIQENEGVIKAILENPLNIEPAKIEHFFLVDFKNPLTGEDLGVKLSGIIDLTSTDDIVIEHKSSSHKYQPDDILKSKQHVGYFVGYYNEFHRVPSKILYNIIYKTKIPVVEVFEVKITSDDVKYYFNWAKKNIEGIERENWTPTPSFNNCLWCDCKLLCKKYRGKV